MEAHLNIMLVSYTPEPESTISAAARLCYSPADIKDVVYVKKNDKSQPFLKKLISMGHMSPLEHASFTFAIEGISRACSHQLVRHRLASYSQQSQRYVDIKDEFGYIIPEAIKNNSDLRHIFEKVMDNINNDYQKLVKELIKAGRKREEALEDARFVLPNATETKIIMTMNARELLHFFNQRLCMRAQWEIRNMAMEMLKIVKKVAPVIFANAGPSCLGGKCPEGQLTCGKTEEVRKHFHNITIDK